MPRIRTLGSPKPPAGWDDVAPQLEEFHAQMRDAVNEPHEGKRRNEATWPITKIHHERTRYVYELFHKKRAISKELYDYLLRERFADAELISKWKKPGFEYLCSLQAIHKGASNFGTTSICRVPLHLRKSGSAQPSSVSGCISCASFEASRLGGPIWWDSPRPRDLIEWAKAGCPTAEKSGKRRRTEESAEVAARGELLPKLALDEARQDNEQLKRDFEEAQPEADEESQSEKVGSGAEETAAYPDPAAIPELS